VGCVDRFISVLITGVVTETIGRGAAVLLFGVVDVFTVLESLVVCDGVVIVSDSARNSSDGGRGSAEEDDDNDEEDAVATEAADGEVGCEDEAIDSSVRGGIADGVNNDGIDDIGISFVNPSLKHTIIFLPVLHNCAIVNVHKVVNVSGRSLIACSIISPCLSS
jgi:hypothetical protein